MKTLTAIVPCRNEDKYLHNCLKCIREAGIDDIIVVLDRCTDGSKDIANTFNCQIITVNKHKWDNPIPENLYKAVKKVDTEFFVNIGADTIIPPNFKDVLKTRTRLVCPIAVISSTIRTIPVGWVNKLFNLWERTYSINLGVNPRGSTSVVRLDPYNEVGGFRDCIAEDTDLWIRLKKKGWTTFRRKDIISYDIRDKSLTRMIKRQITAGRARRELNYSLVKTILHAIFRLRPFVILGYLRPYYYLKRWLKY